MNTSLKGKVAVVTGGTRGIGRAVAARLLQEGASVAICGRSAESVAEAVEKLDSHRPGGIIGKAADVSNLQDVKSFLEFVDERLGGPDILINNAGVGLFRSVAELAPEEWRRILDTNLTGVYYFCHEMVPRFRSRGGGFIINIGSLAGRNPFSGGAAYNASKFGLNGFTEAMMLDHRYDDIRVSCIMPGSVDTDFGSGSKGMEWKIAPQDIADVVMSVLSMPERTLISRVEVRPSKPKR